MNGAFVIDKPSGWTSHDVVGKLRRILGTKKIGHLGTLDPLATGVLPVLVNRATRLAQYFIRNDKVYEGVIRFGFATDSYDADGRPASEDTKPCVSLDEITREMRRFQGTFLQTPPPVSAKKVAGRKAYELARKNIAVELKPVEVTVSTLDVLDVGEHEARIRVECTAGTYVRSIAHELGLALGCGAHLKSLRRLRSGPFDVSQARTLAGLEEAAAAGLLENAMIPSAQLLPEIPMEIVDSITESQIRQGRDFRVSPFRSRGDAKLLKAVSRSGDLIAIGEIRLPNLYHPILVL